MVSSQNRETSSKFQKQQIRTDELNQWIRKVRSKKIVKKRISHGEDLRVLAMLTSALQNAEQNLRRKQEERAQKWAQLKSRLEPQEIVLTEQENALKKQTIDDLWSTELNGLNDFMKNLHQVRAS